MDLNLFGLLIDSGLCVLAWMVQLIVYPGFLDYSPTNLLKWHKKYTPRITGIVAPLMLSQLGLAIYRLIQEPIGISTISFLLVLAIWIITFIWFVPLHQKIDEGVTQQNYLRKLVQLSWYRTLPWTFVLLLNLVDYLS